MIYKAHSSIVPKKKRKVRYVKVIMKRNVVLEAKGELVFNKYTRVVNDFNLLF